MRLLLDTHVLLWWDAGTRMRADAMAAIRDADEVYVSAVTGWEVSIKTALGRLRARRTVAAAVRESGFIELPISLAHAEALASLPDHHRDPFDRMLVAQATAEDLTVVTRDPLIAKYDVKRLLA